MTYHYKDKIGVYIKGKKVQEFKVKQVNPCCDKVLKRYVVHTYGYNHDSFKLVKLGQ